MKNEPASPFVSSSSAPSLAFPASAGLPTSKGSSSSRHYWEILALEGMSSRGRGAVFPAKAAALAPLDQTQGPPPGREELIGTLRQVWQFPRMDRGPLPSFLLPQRANPTIRDLSKPDGEFRSMACGPPWPAPGRKGALPLAIFA